MSCCIASLHSLLFSLQFYVVEVHFFYYHLSFLLFLVYFFLSFLFSHLIPNIIFLLILVSSLYFTGHCHLLAFGSHNIVSLLLVLICCIWDVTTLFCLGFSCSCTLSRSCLCSCLIETYCFYLFYNFNRFIF